MFRWEELFWLLSSLAWGPELSLKLLLDGRAMVAYWSVCQKNVFYIIGVSTCGWIFEIVEVFLLIMLKSVVLWSSTVVCRIKYFNFQIILMELKRILRIGTEMVNFGCREFSLKVFNCLLIMFSVYNRINFEWLSTVRDHRLTQRASCWPGMFRSLKCVIYE